MLSDVATGRLIRSIAAEGGLQSALWAGPEAKSENSPEPHDQPTMRTRPIRLQLGFASDEFCYSIDLGLPIPSQTLFGFDPIIKRECVWVGSNQTGRSLCADRRGGVLKCRNRDGGWVEVLDNIPTFESMLTCFADPVGAPEVLLLRESVRSWRFYDQLRTDREAPARLAQVGTRTPVLGNDGADLAAALQTIREMGDDAFLAKCIDDAFPGSQIQVESIGNRLELRLTQPGLSRSLTATELSEGTLRYLMLVAALLSPRAPQLLVLNEPEMSLHPELLPALGRMILECSRSTQIIIVTHAQVLQSQLHTYGDCSSILLEKYRGATQIAELNEIARPQWKWPAR